MCFLLNASVPSVLGRSQEFRGRAQTRSAYPIFDTELVKYTNKYTAIRIQGVGFGLLRTSLRFPSRAKLDRQNVNKNVARRLAQN